MGSPVIRLPQASSESGPLFSFRHFELPVPLLPQGPQMLLGMPYCYFVSKCSCSSLVYSLLEGQSLTVRSCPKGFCRSGLQPETVYLMVLGMLVPWEHFESQASVLAFPFPFCLPPASLEHQGCGCPSAFWTCPCCLFSDGTHYCSP